mgnify:CR=1 FL=1
MNTYKTTTESLIEMEARLQSLKSNLEKIRNKAKKLSREIK